MKIPEFHIPTKCPYCQNSEPHFLVLVYEIVEETRKVMKDRGVFPTEIKGKVWLCENCVPFNVERKKKKEMETKKK